MLDNPRLVRDTTYVLGEAAAYQLSGTTGVIVVMIYVLFTVMSVVSLLIIGNAFDEGE